MGLHRRQFVVGPEPLRVRQEWRTIKLADDRYLSHCPTLPVERVGNLVLVGIAVHTQAVGRFPASDIPGTATGSGVETRDWSGRWVLIGPETIQADATGTLGCFIRRTERSLWVSSSTAILRRLEPPLAPPSPPLEHARGMDWYPPPGSGITGIERLLPSQLLAGGRVIPRTLVRPRKPASYAAILTELGERLKIAITNLSTLSDDLWLPLSAGRDSRLLLAAARAADVEVMTYTFAGPGVSRADIELPPRLAAAAGYDHTLVTAGELDPALLRLFDDHTDGQTVDADRAFFASGAWAGVPGDTLHLGGSVFEAGRCYYHRALPDRLPDAPAEIVSAIARSLPPGDPAGLYKWAEWLQAEPNGSCDWRDRFYIEQRLAGWLSAIEQGCDLNQARRVHVANCEGYLAATLAIPEHVRRLGLHQDNLIAKLAPALTGFPVNPPDSLAARVADRLRREQSLFREQGNARTYVGRRIESLRERRSAHRMM